MSNSASIADFRAALTTPGARTPVLASLLARMPIAMVGLALLLYVQRETDSFAVAGFVSAGTLVGVAIGAVGQGRIMDRTGPTRPLLVASGLFVATVVAEIVAIETRQHAVALVGLGWLIGLTQPMISSASRALWTHLLPPGPARQAAIAYEAISLEVFFILGPALAGILVAAPWAGTALVASAVCMTVGAVGFALSAVVRAVRPAPRGGGSLLGALGTPGMRTVALAALGFGVTVGFVEVAIPAAATNAGYAPLGGMMLAAWSLTSVVFGVFYAARPWPRQTNLRLPFLLGVFALFVAPMAIPSSLLGLALLSLVAGMWITPQSTTHSMSIDVVAPGGTATEAFGWIVTSVTLGLAGGQSTSGYLVEHVGVWASFLSSSVAGLAIAVAVWLRRHTIVEQRLPAPSLVTAA
ncbi:MFS transporter [Actinophytocola oryzae]|uniref:MFS transporter n=1 Tax=Actinophytocola oryzae TaxID=502181 RepID=A0A4R7UVY1_9PSEU|nr:MFS transporter [Actinophytocola oryzae]TDV40640.1 MFS transporter [Actinophytocola oryzae]